MGRKKITRNQALFILLLTEQLRGDTGLLCGDCSYVNKQYPLLVFPVTILVLMIIACSCCCYSCCSCDGHPDHRRRKIQVRPAAHSWSATSGYTIYYQGHARTSWFSPMGMTFYTRPLEMAITVTINMTQRTRNHSMEFLLSVTATTVTRKVMLLYHHCLLLLGWGESAGHMLLRNKHAFPLTALRLGQPTIPSVSMEPQTKAENTEAATC